MANNMTDYLEKKLLDHSLGVASYTMPTTIYLALCTADPTETGSTSSEIVGNAYVRQAIPFSAATSGAGTTSNSTDVLFPVASAAWGTITHFGLMDASSGGNMLWYGQLTAQKVVASSDQFKMGATKVAVSLG